MAEGETEMREHDKWRGDGCRTQSKEERATVRDE